MCFFNENLFIWKFSLNVLPKYRQNWKLSVFFLQLRCSTITNRKTREYRFLIVFRIKSQKILNFTDLRYFCLLTVNFLLKFLSNYKFWNHIKIVLAIFACYRLDTHLYKIFWWPSRIAIYPKKWVNGYLFRVAYPEKIGCE